MIENSKADDELEKIPDRKDHDTNQQGDSLVFARFHPKRIEEVDVYGGLKQLNYVKTDKASRAYSNRSGPAR
jgi:hypothetical protein